MATNDIPDTDLSDIEPNTEVINEAPQLSDEQKTQLHDFFYNGAFHTADEVRKWFEALMPKNMDQNAKSSMLSLIEKEISDSTMWDAEKKFFRDLLADASTSN